MIGTIGDAPAQIVLETVDTVAAARDRVADEAQLAARLEADIAQPFDLRARRCSA